MTSEDPKSVDPPKKEEPTTEEETQESNTPHPYRGGSDQSDGEPLVVFKEVSQEFLFSCATLSGEISRTPLPLFKFYRYYSGVATDWIFFIARLLKKGLGLQGPCCERHTGSIQGSYRTPWCN